MFLNLFHLEFTSLRVERELVEPHGADEGDVGRLAIHHFTLEYTDESDVGHMAVHHFALECHSTLYTVHCMYTVCIMYNVQHTEVRMHNICNIV